MLIPGDALAKARRLRICPRKATKTVTKDNSMDLAKAAVNSEAVLGDRCPCEDTRWLYLGLRIAKTTHIPENIVE